MIKFLITLKPFIRPSNGKKLRYCITCENLATQEACFDVGQQVTIIEKYCDKCAKKVLR
jgi:hypothetical protein